MEYFHLILGIVFYIYLVMTVVLLLLDNREPSTTMAWVMVFILLPVVGVVFYIFIGRNWRRVDERTKLSQQFLEDKIAVILAPLIEAQVDRGSRLEQKQDVIHKRKLFHLLQRNSNSILTTSNTIEVLQNGSQKFPRLKEDLRGARASIHMEYFIWRCDPLTKEIKDILIAKRREGVEIRILYDAIGSIFLDHRYVREMRAAGIEMYPYFNFLSPLKIHTLNYRNHRKVVVVDGRIGYAGGMNMGQEYVDGGKQFDFWRDTHLRMSGEAVNVLQGIFVTSWYNTTGKELFDAKYFPPVAPEQPELPVQVSTSGPDSRWPSIKHLYFTLISSAQKKVYIQSPYFIPDPSVHTALKMAAFGGLDVRVIIAGVPDKKLPYWSAFTYFKDLLRAGVRIYHYQKGFMHAKTIMIDSEICSVGTANMDVRSFHLNYELNMLLYDEQITAGLEKDFMRDVTDSREFTLEDYEQLSEAVKLRNSLARLLAPLL